MRLAAIPIGALRFVAAGAVALTGLAAGGTGRAQAAGSVALRVHVNAQETLGPADLETFRGVCLWNLPGDPDQPMHRAWTRAGFIYPRGPWLNVDVSRDSAAGPSGRQTEGGSSSLVLQFGVMDASLADYQRMRLRPLFSFGVPAALTPNLDRKPGDWSYSAPADYNLWREYVSRLVDYVVEKGYRGAHYEILNEPEDTSCWRGKPGSKDTLADYLEFYLHTAATIKSVDPSAKVGGPASAHWDSVTVSGGAHAWGLPQFLRALAGYAQAHPAESLPLDFISWHDYAFSSTRLSDGADFVDRILAEVKWPVKPEYWVTEWNRSLSDAGVAGHERASHAAWNIIREANPETRRIARLYWYVLDGGGNTALADDTIPVLESQDGVPSARLSPTFAVFEMLRELNRGEYVRVDAQEPLTALATRHDGALRLLVNNNTAERRSALVSLAEMAGESRQVRTRIQLVDERHSSDGQGLEEGGETTWQIGSDAPPVELSLLPYATVLVTLQIPCQ